MRTQTLKTYTKDKLQEYYKKPLYLKQLLLDSHKDVRLAEAAQAYYLAHGKQKEANLFAPFSKQQFSVEEFPTSNQKYVAQFEYNKMVDKVAKMKLKDFVLTTAETKNVSFYRLAKTLGTSQSNVDCFFKKNQENKLSFNQLMKLKEYLNGL